ncbi:thioesterase [Treponema sp. TIM-1]|uniref:acyl-[acyl-carrier-protein] thioesterase n=1 Tax=Treponema sp. TIM-1 TaxID=2898417 RepID=UPI00397F8570
MDIWQETFPLRFGNIDRSDRLTLAATFDFFQEVAISHAESLGVGREAMARTGQGWVLSRISVFFERRPQWGETVTVRSWPRGWDRLFAVRDYDIRDASDTPVVRGRSNWLILDIEKRRPLRPQAVMGTLPLNEGLDALPGGAGSLDARDDLGKAGERQARYSDIDYNGHVNNARYIQWIQDVTDAGVLEQANQMRLDINYLSEIKSGETIELWTAPISGSDAPNEPPPARAIAYEGRRREGDQAVFRAELRVFGGS